MEIILSQDIEKILPQPISFNYEQLKSELSEKLDHYKSIIVTEDSIASGKEDRAKLNNIKKAIGDTRKAIKRDYNKPLELFEAQMKELENMTDETAKMLDVQVKSFEEAEKTKKRTEIEQFYQNNAGELLDVVKIEAFWDDRWLNKTYDIKKCHKEILDTVSRVKNDIGIIKAMKLECETVVLRAYLRKLNMSDALAEKAAFEAEQERLKKLEEVKKASVVEPIVSAVLQSECYEDEPQPVTPQRSEVEPPEEPKTIDVRFYNTTAAFRADMKALTDKHNVRYGGIK